MANDVKEQIQHIISSLPPYERDLHSQLRLQEGFRSKPYRDSVGKLTEGYGWNLEDVPMPEPIASLLLLWLIQESQYQCTKEFPWFTNLTPNRQNVIVNMVFNMGMATFKTFKNTIRFMERNEVDKAAEAMLQSLWAHQVGQRAIELSKQYRLG